MPPNPPLQRILAAEQRGDLWQRLVLGYPAWAMHRLTRFFEEDFGEPRSAQSQSVSQRLKALHVPMSESLRDFSLAPPANNGRDIWVLSLSAYRRKVAGGETLCTLAAHLHEQLADRLLYIERNNNMVSHAPQADTYRMDATHISLMLAAKAAAPLLARTLGKEDRQAFAPTPLALMCQLALYGRAMERLARHWLEVCRPSAVFVLCGYEPFIPIQRAVRAAGIPLIELQHGTFYESHPGYIMGPVIEQLHFPDHLVVFGRHYGELLDRESPRWRGRWTVGGHPWLRRQVAAHRKDSASRNLCILFSQGEAALREPLRALLPELRKQLPSHLTIVIKPHPQEPDCASFYGEHLGPGVTLAKTDDDTYKLLGSCRLAVSVFSTVATEALVAGCTSVVIRSTFWSEEFKQLVESGALHPAETAADVVAALDLDSDKGADELADQFFGLGHEEPDFGALIEQVRVGRAPGEAP